MENGAENLAFNVLRNALYHTARRRSLEGTSRFCHLLVIVLGASAFSGILYSSGAGPALIGAAVAFIGAIQLVYDFNGRARDHQGLQRDYYNLLASIEAEEDPDESQLRAWRGDMIRITGNEPPVLRAIDAKAFNDALDAMDTFESGDRLEIPLMHRLLGGVRTFEGHRYRKVSEIPANGAVHGTL